MTEAEIKNIAEDAAEGALRKFLLMIGVNVSSPEAMIELQRDFTHLRSERLTVGKLRDKVYATIAGSVVTTIIAALGYYFTRH